MNSEYTVISFCEKTGRINTDHVSANNRLQAFHKVAEKDPSLTLVACFNGKLADGVDFDCPGEGLVDGDTILEQSDIFDQTTPESAPMPRKAEIDVDLLDALKHALNIIPNRRVNFGGYRDTYAIASAIGKL